MRIVLLFAAAVALPGQAATPAAYAALDAASERACARASGLKDASVGPPTRFSDAFLMDVRSVEGTAPQPHEKGARQTMLCLYNRRTRIAETQEQATAVPATTAAAPQRDRRYRAEDIGGTGIVDRTEVTLMFGSDGKLTGKSGCNGFGASYALTGTALKVYPPLIGTMLACPPAPMEQERRYRDIVEGAVSADVDATGALTVTARDGRSVRFFADTPPLLSGSMLNLRCGPQRLSARFERGRAVVEIDGTERILKRLPGDTRRGSVQTFTDGRLTLFRTERPLTIRFARGRTAAVPCAIAQV